MTAERIRQRARFERDAGPDIRPEPAAVEFMIEFEQRFGGLWYSILRDDENGMEYGLDGDPALYPTTFGLATRGIMDGSWTSPVYVLEDGRTLTHEGRLVPDRLIDCSVLQRIESDAVLSVAGRWPHHRYGLAVPSGTEPEVSTRQFPPAMLEATGPANRWWLDGDRAVLLRLRRWWTRHSGVGTTGAPLDYWTMWCFARAESDLTWAAARRGDITSDLYPGESWCPLCSQPNPENANCKLHGQ